MAAPAPRTQTLSLGGPLQPGELQQLLRRSGELLATTGAELLLCESGELAADMLSVHALARIALLARRRGCRVALVDAAPQLRSLIGFVGLANVLPCATVADRAAIRTRAESLGVETLGQAEQGKDRVGREEEGELDDPRA
jgi:ABC-type transporter Mla MlaB component